jgi:hypothetical protein
MKTEYGATDSAASSCVLLYDFFGASYVGEPTTNLFTQPSGNAGFSIKPVDTARAFWKLDYYQDLNGQGTFSTNATGFYYLPTDSIYKYNFSSSQTDSTSNKHGFSIKINRGDTYTTTTEVFVSTGHPRTGTATVLSLTPTLTGSFATLSGSYDFSKKGTWQIVKQKIFVPTVSGVSLTSPTYLEVSVKDKTAAHPYYSSGSSHGFAIGNTEGRTLYFYRGLSYVFVQSNSSNVNDELYLTTTPNAGGGTNSYDAGFSYFGNEGFDGYAVFNVPLNAPSIIYYNSRKASSSFVGGKINVLGSYNAGNIGNTGNAGNGGNGGNTGNTGTTNISEAYQICFDPTRGELNGSNLNGGYILYKNMQVEKNKPMFKGVLHSTKFTSSSRSPYSALIDSTGNDNNANLVNAMFNADSHLVFDNRTYLNDGGVVDINLKYNKTKTFSIGDSSIQSYDFWFTQTKASYPKAFLFARSNATNGDYFLENQGYPQLIYIQDKRVYFSFSSPSNEILSGYTDQLIETNNLYNVTITINTNLGIGSKVDIYINGQKVSVNIISFLNAPSAFSFANVRTSVGQVGNSGNLGFININTNFYKISSFDGNGESKASEAISAVSDPTKKSIKLTWNKVGNAAGYYIYRSPSPAFGSSSLLAEINSSNILEYTDENYQLRPGFPKQAPKYNYNYNQNISALVDDPNAKVCFGNYPVSSLTLNHFEGYIYRAGIYSIKLSDSQVFRNYNSFLYKYISQDPSVIGSFSKQRSVIFKRVKE